MRLAQALDRDREDGGELAWLLRGYAGARLSPDQWASIRMRRAIMRHGRDARASRAAGATPASRFGWLGGWGRALRPAAFVGLVGALAVMTGAEAAMSAAPGGPLYGTRLWVETAVVTVQGGGADLRVGQLDQRIDEIAAAVHAGNASAANAASDAYSGEAAAAAQVAQDSTDLLALQAALQRHVVHLRDIRHANPKARASLDPLIVGTVAALAEVNDKLGASERGDPHAGRDDPHPRHDDPHPGHGNPRP
jgi:hypothetical protein